MLIIVSFWGFHDNRAGTYLMQNSMMILCKGLIDYHQHYNLQGWPKMARPDSEEVSLGLPTFRIIFGLFYGLIRTST